MRHVHSPMRIAAVVALCVLATGGAIAGASTHGRDRHPTRHPRHQVELTASRRVLSTGAYLRQVASVSFPAPYANPTSFDVSWVDPVTETYYLADRTNAGIDAINASNNTFGSVIGAGDFTGANKGTNTATPTQISACGSTGTGGPNGVLTIDVGGVRQLIGANGVSGVQPVSTIKIYTLTTSTSGTLSATVSTAVSANGTLGRCRADEMSYDSRDQLLLVANDLDATPYISFISMHANPTLDAVVGQVKFPNATNGIEQSIYDMENHMFYLNIPGVEVAKIDPASMQVVATYLTPNCVAAGLAIDEQSQELLLSCAINPNGVEFMDARTGRITTNIPQVSGADEVWFDPGTNMFYLGANHMTSTGSPVPSISTTGSAGTWTLSESGATGGSFTLTVGTATTAAIAANASAAAIASALDVIVPGTTATGGPLPASVTVTFPAPEAIFTANSASLVPAGYNTPVLGVIAAGHSSGRHGRDEFGKSMKSTPSWVENMPEPSTQGSHSVAADPVNGNVFVPLSGSGIAVFGWTNR